MAINFEWKLIMNKQEEETKQVVEDAVANLKGKIALTPEMIEILKEKKKSDARKRAAERSATAIKAGIYTCKPCNKNLSSATALKTHVLSARHLSQLVGAVKL